MRRCRRRAATGCSASCRRSSRRASTSISIWLGTAYENMEQHDAVVAFSVEGDDLGRLHRLVKLGTDWKAERTDGPPIEGPT